MLRIESVSKKLGGIQALGTVTLAYDGQGVIGIAGPNGSGKTTLLNIITGHVVPDHGSVIFRNRRIDGLPLVERARLGIVRTYQGGRIFPNLTVEENLFVAGRWTNASDWKRLFQRTNTTYVSSVNRALEEVGLYEKRSHTAATLSFGQRRRLEMARVILSSEKGQLFLFDEPTMGVDPEFLETLEALIFHLKALGKGVIVVEHNLNFLQRVADRLLVLETGKILADGFPREVLISSQVKKYYEGEVCVA